MGLAEIDHRSDGEEHAGLQRPSCAGPADMDDVGLVMKHAAQAVPAEIAHHAHALRLDKTLDGVADVAGGGAGFYRGDAAHHRLIGYFNQPPALPGNPPPPPPPPGIPIPPLNLKDDAQLSH